MKTFPLICKVPINFEFEFKCLVDNPDLKVVPAKGIVPGNGRIDISFIYTPSITAVVSNKTLFMNL